MMSKKEQRRLGTGIHVKWPSACDVQITWTRFIDGREVKLMASLSASWVWGLRSMPATAKLTNFPGRAWHLRSQKSHFVAYHSQSMEAVVPFRSLGKLLGVDYASRCRKCGCLR
ncbi:hypothetical protein C8R48DRAFT_688506 [Suillus tomentosus]|nr:hypothetical protein C8R48DRAFT_688506 [Suillus tomentosus]